MPKRGRFDKPLAAARQVGWRFHVALVLAYETGHRTGAIRKLTWSDIDFEGKTIRWRAEHEKTGCEHVTPLTAEALDALKDARRMGRGKKDGPVLPRRGMPRGAQTAFPPFCGGRRPRPSRDWSRGRAEAGTRCGESSRRT